MEGDPPLNQAQRNPLTMSGSLSVDAVNVGNARNVGSSDIGASRPAVEAVFGSGDAMAGADAAMMMTSRGAGLSTGITPFGHPLSQSMYVKLDKTNYLLWKTLLMPAIKGYNLDGILLGEIPYPPKSDQETGAFNPSYQNWYSKDQLLLYIILNSLTPSVTSQILRVANSSAHEVWKAIANLCGAQNKSRIQVCRNAILTARKGNKTMSQYLQTLKENDDSLASAGAPMPESDLIVSALTGLDIEYTKYSADLQERTSLTWPEMYASLLGFEARLQQVDSVTVNLGKMSVTPVANAAFVRPTTGSHKIGDTG
ncbi:hypothetical protein Scep_003992 [Stephania cephalantha]|uniref:Retrotransposon Copia-like N-terminal domain-containing protein n=1 Tax=Stephania cephalantha TaxID=152367 RepID=A0AAP0PV03_9MAGN